MKTLSLGGAQTSCLWGRWACSLSFSSSRRDARSLHKLKNCNTIALTLLVALAAIESRAQNEPILVPDVVDFSKLIPVLPDAPQGWTADKP